MCINNCGQLTASGLDVMDHWAGVRGGAGNGSVDVSALIPQRSARLAQEAEGASGGVNKRRLQTRLAGHGFLLIGHVVA